MSMTRNELTRRFPNATESFIKANLGPESAGPDTVMERPVGNDSLAKDKSQEGAARPVHIRFTSVRKRLCDPDNLSVKWLLDCLRYCGAIAGDEPEKITLEVGQKKAAKGQQEHTLIELFS